MPTVQPAFGKNSSTSYRGTFNMQSGHIKVETKEVGNILLIFKIIFNSTFENFPLSLENADNSSPVDPQLKVKTASPKKGYDFSSAKVALICLLKKVLLICFYFTVYSAIVVRFRTVIYYQPVHFHINKQCKIKRRKTFICGKTD